MICRNAFSALALLLAAIMVSVVFFDAAQAESANNPIVFSKTVISIVPGTTIPKAVLRDTTEPAEEMPMEGEMEGAAPPAQEEKATLEMQVRGRQIPLNSGMYTKYKLSASRGVLTYYPTAEPRHLMAENIYEPVDILFVRDDGVIAQIIPEVVLAYLREDVRVGFPLRATIYVTAGLSEALGIQPGDRVEHGMFTPKPVIQMVQEPES